MFRTRMVKDHMNNKCDSHIPVLVHVLCTIKAQVSSSPDACPMVHKLKENLPLSASAGKFAIFCVSFCQGKQLLYNDIQTKR